VPSALHIGSGITAFANKLNSAKQLLESSLSQSPSLIIDHHLNGQLMNSLLIFKCPMSHGTMKYTLKAHVCYYFFMAWLLHYLYSLHADFYTSENIINIEI
jgi:hypothetical protein